MHAGEFRDQSAQARAITRPMLAWHRRFEPSSAALTLALLQDEVVDLHRQGWQLDDLMGVVGPQRDQVAIATGTGAGLDEMDFGGAEQGGAFALMALLPTAFATGRSPLALGSVEGRIRRRRLT